MAEKVKDGEAPPALTIEVRTSDGKVWGTFVAVGKEFKTGSVGYYAGEKVTNPKSGARYQLGCNITLIGSKG
jgi:hypothetical protein